MKIVRATACAVMAAALFATAAAQAQRGAGGAGMPQGAWAGSGMHGGGWDGGRWHGGGWHHAGPWHGGYGASVAIHAGPGIYWGWPYWPYDFDAWPNYGADGSAYGYAYLAPHVTYAYPSDPAYYVGPLPDRPPEPPSFRYYCGDPKGYYPQVNSCTQPWLRVLPDDARPAGDASGAPGAPPSGK